MNERQLKQRILSVEDEPAIGRLLVSLLERTGRYKVTVETEPFRALETARRFRPDLLILDVRMPGKSGIEVAQQARCEPWLRYRPILLFSGFDLAESAFRSTMGDGPTEFLKKGAAMQTVLHAVERLLAAPASPPEFPTPW